MTTLFWLALVLGGGLALLSLLGDVLGMDHDSSHASPGDADADGLHILSLRSATYFLFAFGAVGVLLDLSWHGRLHWLALVAALATGAAASVFSTSLFRWVSRTASGEMPADSTLVGLTGEMVLPLRNGTGKVLVSRGGREHELLARPFDDDARDAESWKNVVVVEIKDGTAFVSPLDQSSSESLLPSSIPQEP